MTWIACRLAPLLFGATNPLAATATGLSELRLIASDDARPARWIRQIASITVVGAP